MNDLSGKDEPMSGCLVESIIVHLLDLPDTRGPSHHIH
jgi:hypothetical protein